MASEFLEVAARLMEREKRAMSPKELVRLAIEGGLFSDNIAGRTPHQTMKAKLSVDIRTKGEQSSFVRTAPGKFHLRRLLDSDSQEYHAPPLRPPLPREQVLVFPVTWLDGEDRFQGVRTQGAEKLLNRLFRSGTLTYIDRMEAEQNGDYKQIVTYVLVARGRELLRFQRGNFSRVADFLRGNECIGFGGHVTAADITLFAGKDYGILDSVARELGEELRLPEADRRRLAAREGLEFVGLLNDDSSSVGERHFAILYRYQVSEDQQWKRPERNEKSITRLKWVDPAAKDFSLHRLEYWSKLTLIKLYGKEEGTKPTFNIRRRAPFRPPHLLLVLGGVGSGKSFTTEILRSEFSYQEVNSGRVVAELLSLPPVTEDTRLDFQKAAWEMISRPDGPGRLASALWDKVERSSAGRSLIDGVRQRATIEELRRIARERGKRIGLVYVDTPPFLSFEFYRARSGNTKNIADYLQARNSLVEQEVSGLIELADAVLFNWRGQKDYRAVVHAMMAEVGITP